ncbi:ROK family protein [Telmatospirillum sp.]|uniref:ROK family protein n=1 Tax=Telmatospirillum sp. TaxID=2079197 RepID=UPI00283DCE97|nr:ROK family protein [Telmatospirillum sp.]MDR3440125.1 ROK family protein [Telmatospirillum sp.]
MRLAIDLGGTNLRVGARDGTAAWTHLHRERCQLGFSPQHLVARLHELIRRWQVTPTAIGVSVAAVVVDGGCLRGSENLGWAGVPLGSILHDAFHQPVAIETDVFCGAFYEVRAGAARGLSSALYISVGTGVGHAVILDGKVWRGAAGGANALGHLILQRDGAPCHCGHSGCLCTVASGLAQSDPTPPPKPIEHLAQAIGAAVTFFEPQTVILSGGALNQPWFALDPLVAAISQFAFPAARLPEVVLSPATEPNLLGADYLAMEQS